MERLTRQPKGIKMNHKELAAQLALASGMKKSDAENALGHLVESIVNALERGEKVKINYLGTFSTKQMAAKKGRNPKSGEAVDVPAKIKAVFTAAKELKADLN